MSEKNTQENTQAQHGKKYPQSFVMGISNKATEKIAAAVVAQLTQLGNLPSQEGEEEGMDIKEASNSPYVTVEAFEDFRKEILEALGQANHANDSKSAKKGPNKNFVTGEDLQGFKDDIIRAVKGGDTSDDSKGKDEKKNESGIRARFGRFYENQTKQL